MGIWSRFQSKMNKIKKTFTCKENFIHKKCIKVLTKNLTCNMIKGTNREKSDVKGKLRGT